MHTPQHTSREKRRRAKGKRRNPSDEQRRLDEAPVEDEETVSIEPLHWLT